MTDREKRIITAMTELMKREHAAGASPMQNAVRRYNSPRSKWLRRKLAEKAKPKNEATS